MANNARLFQRASNASVFLQRSQANQDLGNSASDMQKLAQRSPNNLQVWWNSNPKFQSQVAQMKIPTNSLNFSNPQTVLSFTNQVQQSVASNANYMNQYTSQAYQLQNEANTVRATMNQSQAGTQKVSRAESDSISASVSSASTSASQASASESTQPLVVDHQPEESFWTPIKSAEDQNNQFNKVNNRYRNRNYRKYKKHPSYTMYGSNDNNKHGPRNKYGFNILDYCDYANIPYENVSGDTYQILSSGYGHGDFSSLFVTQVPNSKRVPDGHGGYTYVNAHDGRTYSQLNRFSTKLSGLKGLDSLTQFIINYNDWDENVGPNEIKRAKKRRNHFFHEYAEEGHFQTEHPVDDDDMGVSHEVHNATGKHNHHVSKVLANKKWQEGTNEDVHFADSVMRAYKGAFNSHYTQSRILKQFENITHMPSQQAQRQIHDYKIVRERSIKHGTTIQQELKKDPYKLVNEGKILNQVYNRAINDTNNFVNKNVIDNSIAMNYLHNKRGIDKRIVNYLISRGLVKGLQSDTYKIHIRDPKTHKIVEKKVNEDPRVEFLHRIPDTPKIARGLKNPLSNRPQQTSSDLYLTKGVQEEKPSGADLIYLNKYSYKDPKTHKTIYYYDKDHQAYGNSKKVDKNSYKNYGWNFRIGNGKDKLYVFEAPIDAISFVELHRNDHEALHNASFLALGGADSKSKTIQNYINAQFPTKGQFNHIIVAPDNDWAGYQLVQDVMGEFGDRAQYVAHRPKGQKLVTSEVPLSDNGTIDRKYAYQKKHGIKVNGKISPFNKDWNEMLQKQNFYNVKFPAPGKPLNADQYGQHTVNQFMELLNKSDQQKFNVIANTAGTMQKNDHVASELIDKNNPRVVMMTQAYDSLTSRLNVMTRYTNNNKSLARIELGLYNKMGNRTHKQKMKLYHRVPSGIQRDYVKNYKQIQKISNTDYGREKFDKFMGHAGQYLSGTDMARYANKAYIAMYHSRNKMLNNPIVQKTLSKPYPKPKAQMQIESFMKHLPNDDARKLFVTATRSTHNISERKIYMQRHPRLFQTRKNIYCSQMDIDKIVCNKAYKDMVSKYPSTQKQVQGLMQQLSNDRINDRYDVAYKYANQCLHQKSEFPYAITQVVTDPNTQNKLRFYKKAIDSNNKLSWENYRRYSIRKYHKDPEAVYKQRAQNRKNFYKKMASGKPFVTKGVSNVYIQAMRAYHYELTHTKAGQAVIQQLHKQGISDQTINSKMIGYAPDTPILKRALNRSGIKNKDIKASHLIKLNGQDRFNNQIVYPDIQYNGNQATGIRQIVGRYTNGQSKGQVLVRPMTMKPRKPKKKKNFVDVIPIGNSAKDKHIAKTASQFGALLTKQSVFPTYKLVHAQISAKLHPEKRTHYNNISKDAFKHLSKTNQEQFGKMKLSNMSPEHLGALINMDVDAQYPKEAKAYKQRMAKNTPKMKASQQQQKIQPKSSMGNQPQGQSKPINPNPTNKGNGSQPTNKPVSNNGQDPQTNNQQPNLQNQGNNPAPNSNVDANSAKKVVDNAPQQSGNIPVDNDIDETYIPPEDNGGEEPADADYELSLMRSQDQQGQQVNQNQQNRMASNMNQQQDQNQNQNNTQATSQNSQQPNNPSSASNNTKTRMNSIMHNMNNINGAVDKGNNKGNLNLNRGSNQRPNNRSASQIASDYNNSNKNMTKEQKVQILRKKHGFLPK